MDLVLPALRGLWSWRQTYLKSLCNLRQICASWSISPCSLLSGQFSYCFTDPLVFLAHNQIQGKSGNSSTDLWDCFPDLLALCHLLVLYSGNPSSVSSARRLAFLLPSSVTEFCDHAHVWANCWKTREKEWISRVGPHCLSFTTQLIKEEWLEDLCWGLCHYFLGSGSWENRQKKRPAYLFTCLEFSFLCLKHNQGLLLRLLEGNQM